ncbi:MAG: rhomboid family intramembrane serine protease [Verrucomicrobiota bacterium]|nr:rhomboid family intramembrane serine protease [Verrucomicrobiota bacterium]
MDFSPSTIPPNLVEIDYLFDEKFGKINIIQTDWQIVIEWITVLSSQYIDYTLIDSQEKYYISVDYNDFQKARIEILSYEEDRNFFKHFRDISHGKTKENEHLFSWSAYYICLCMIAFHVITGPANGNSQWIIAGRMSAQAVMDGQLWRTVTALTLHADFVHVCSNSLFLIIFSSYLCSFIKPGITWLFLLFTGIFGNYLSVFFYSEPHYAVGSSTLVFGALGMLGMIRLLERRTSEKQLNRKQYFIPMIAALALLCLNGTGINADIAAHFSGFFSGMILGFPFFSLKKYAENILLQTVCAFSTFFVLFSAWFIALDGVMF